MKKWLKISLGVIGGIALLLVIDLVCVFTINRPLFAIKKDNGSVYKGILYDTYNCAEYSVPQIKAKGTKFTCHVSQKEQDSTEFYDKDLVQCLESELGGYLVTEKDDLVEIPLSQIKKDDHDKIEYYKGVYASEHSDNMYVMVYPINGTYDSAVMKDFDKYFYEKFSSAYQKYESPTTPTIYIHTNDNDIDFKEITNKCVTRKNTEDGKSIPTETLNKINDTTKIIIKSSQEELGIITDKEKLAEVLSAISSSKRYGKVCTSDGYGFEFNMYDKNNKLIDTIYIWGDGARLMPKSLNGCPYVTTNNNDLRKIIEDATDYIFYGILDFRDDINQTEQTLIYKDGKNSYYLNSKDPNEILIKFMLNNKVMTLKYALENEYISAENVSKDYPDILIKK